MKLEVSGGVSVYQSHFLMVNSTVVIGNKYVALFDPAYFPDEVALLGNDISAMSVRDRFFFYTHFDFDHVVDPPRLDAYRIASSQVKDRDLEQDRLQWQGYDSQLYVERREWAYPQIHRYVEADREFIDLGGEELLVQKVPGHTVDSLFFLFSDRHLAVAGDMLSDKEFPFVFAGVKDYYQSLQTVKALVSEYSIQTLVPGHGNIATGEQISRRIDCDLRYLADLQSAAARVGPAGMGDEELTKLAEEVLYNGEPVQDWQAGGHRRNLKKAIDEA